MTSRIADAPVGQFVLNRPTDEHLAANRVAGLIAQLGDDRFEMREEASRRLSQMGIEIQPGLDSAIRDSDPEIRIRARRVLDTVRKTDLERRLNAFAADVNDLRHYDLPGWSRYRQIVGTSGAARRLFVEMQRAEPSLFRAVEDGPAATSTAIEDAITEDLARGTPRSRYMGGNMVPLGSIAALFFVASDNQVTIGDDPATQLIGMTNSQTIQLAANSGSQATAIKKILGAWVSRDATSNVLYMNLWLAMRFELKEAVGPAARALRQANQPGYVKQPALMLIARLGDKSNLPAIESCFTDADVCNQGAMNNRPMQTEVRDIALAVAIHLHGQDPRSFGFDHFGSWNNWPYNNSMAMGFYNDSDRNAAMKKWASWVANHRVVAGASTPSKKS